MKRMNKKGIGIFLGASLILGFLVISIIASYFGLKFVSTILEGIKWEYFIGIGIFALAIIFKPFVTDVLMTIWGWIKGLTSALLGFLKLG